MQANRLHDRAALTVVIADESPMMRTMLTYFIESLQGVSLIGQACNVPEAIAALSHLKPDVLVVDNMMEGRARLDVVRAANSGQLRPAIIVFTTQSRLHYRMAAMKAGADIFLDKASETTLLLDILKRMRNEDLTTAHEGESSPSTKNIPCSRMRPTHPHYHPLIQGVTPCNSQSIAG